MENENKSILEAEGASSPRPRCPKCGFVMCQQFDTQRINEHADLATPNGTYVCYGCNLTYAPERETESDQVA